MNVKKYTNGLTIIQHTRSSPTTAVSVTVKVGSNHERKNEYGISHFMEHMLFEGTNTRDALTISSEIEGVGGEIGAYTTNDRTVFYIKALNRHINASLDVLSDILQNPLFAEPSIEKERNVILSEVNLRRDEPRYFQWELFLRTTFRGYLPGHAIIGDVDAIKAITRDDLKRFFKKYYVPNNMVISCVGGRDCISEVAHRFDTKFSAPLTELRYRCPLLNKNAYAREKRDITQTYLVIGFRSVPLTHNDSVILEVIRAIFGKGMSGKIFDEIRNKRGLAYDLGVHHNPSVRHGFFAIYVNCEPKHTTACQRIILDLLRNYTVTERDLTDAKRFIEGEFIMENEEHHNLADMLSLYQISGNMQSFTRYVRQVQNVSLRDVRRVMKKYFKHYTRVIIGN